MHCGIWRITSLEIEKGGQVSVSPLAITSASMHASSGRALLGEASGCQFMASEKKCPAWRVDGPRSSYDSSSFA